MTARNTLLAVLIIGLASMPGWAASARRKPSPRSAVPPPAPPPAAPADEPEPDSSSAPSAKTREPPPPGLLEPLQDEDPLPPAQAPLSAGEPALSQGQSAWGHAGVYFHVGYGYNWWSLDRAKVASQIGSRDDPANFFNSSAVDAQTASLRGGYNVAGHAHAGFHFLATGWEVLNSARGGAGYIGGEVGWHPLSLVSALLPSGPIPGEQYYDSWLEAGLGYGIVGKKRAMDGGIATFGLAAEGYPLPWLSLGLRTTWYFPFFNRYILDYDHRADPGMSLELPRGSGGSFLAFNAFVAFHFGTSEIAWAER
jgi:hypothetical protein